MAFEFIEKASSSPDIEQALYLGEIIKNYKLPFKTHEEIIDVSLLVLSICSYNIIKRSDLMEKLDLLVI